MGYSRHGAPSIFPLDKALALPARSFSYELQRRLVKAAVQNPFLESVQTIAELTGVSVSKRSLEEILPDAARDFDAFYQQRSLATAAGAIHYVNGHYAICPHQNWWDKASHSVDRG
jgi:hypothetical protein